MKRSQNQENNFIGHSCGMNGRRCCPHIRSRGGYTWLRMKRLQVSLPKGRRPKISAFATSTKSISCSKKTFDGGKWPEDLLTGHLLRNSDDDRQATIADRSQIWPLYRLRPEEDRFETSLGAQNLRSLIRRPQVLV